MKLFIFAVPFMYKKRKIVYSDKKMYVLNTPVNYIKQKEKFNLKKNI